MFYKWCIEVFEKVATERIKRRMSMAALSLLMKKGITFVWRILGHDRGPRLGDAVQSLEQAGDELPPDAFHESFERVPRDLVRILASCRERQGLEPSPFLVAMAPRLLALSNKPTKEEARWRSRLSRIRRLERLRFVDHRLAKRKLEWLIGLGTALLERLVEPPRLAIGDLACALASLAVVYRQSGRRDDALDAFLLGWPLAANETKAEGVVLQRCAYLLVDLCRCDRAQEFLEEALARFTLADARAEAVEILVDMGYVLSHAGQSEKARQWLLKALPLIPPENREYRFAAHQLLSYELGRLGRYSEAIAEAKAAESLVDNYMLALGSLYWSRACLAAKQKQPQEAIGAYRRSLDLYEKHASEALVATLTFEFAEYLIRQDRRPELLELAAGSIGWAGEVVRNTKIRELFEDLVALIASRQLNIESLEAIRKALPADELLAPIHTRRGTQPPGGNCGPYSGPVSVAGLLFGGKSALPDVPPVAG